MLLFFFNLFLIFLNSAILKYDKCYNKPIFLYSYVSILKIIASSIKSYKNSAHKRYNYLFKKYTFITSEIFYRLSFTVLYER